MKAQRCSFEIDGPKIDRRGNVAWRRQCKKMTTHPSGRCQYHPSSYDDDRVAWYPGEPKDLHKSRAEREG